MAQPVNTQSRYNMIGIREDLEDVIFDISPEDTPVISNIERGKAKNTFHEWQTFTKAAANKDNAAIEGDTFAGTALTATQRLGNYTQIFQKGVIVSDTTFAVDAAGRANELKFQLAVAGTELKRDLEAAVTQNNPGVAGNNTTARKLAGIESWLSTNISSGVGGSTTATTSGAPAAAPTDGTPRAFTEVLLKTAISLAFGNGAKMKMLVLGAAQKQVFSAFAGIAAQRYDANNRGSKPMMTAIIGAADIYVSDFGNLSVVPDLFSRNRTALGIDPEYLSLATLRPMEKRQMAKISDGEQWQVIMETTLVMRNEKANFKVADLT
jgi:hypothetical protein